MSGRKKFPATTDRPAPAQSAAPAPWLRVHPDIFAMPERMAEADPLNFGDEANIAAKPRAKRDSLFLLAPIASEGGGQVGQAKVRNLSATGLMADCDIMFTLGDRIELALRGVGQIFGTVVRADGKRIGVHFDRSIDPQQARKPVEDRPADNLPPYLRHLNRSSRFAR